MKAGIIFNVKKRLQRIKSFIFLKLKKIFYLIAYKVAFYIIM